MHFESSPEAGTRGPGHRGRLAKPWTAESDYIHSEIGVSNGFYFGFFVPLLRAAIETPICRDGR